jgi:hypothetical protein
MVGFCGEGSDETAGSIKVLSSYPVFKEDCVMELGVLSDKNDFGETIF